MWISVLPCVFPDVYEIGMSHLGIQILYDMFNKMDKVYCERVYSPWHDLDKIIAGTGYSVVYTGNTAACKEYGFFWEFTIQYEMCYTNILQILDLSKIPLYSKDRNEEESDCDWRRSMCIQSGADCGIF